MREVLHLIKGRGRTKVDLSMSLMGRDILVYIYNEQAHLGAIAIGEYSKEERRTSVSVLTRLGHKDDAIAQKAAYLISKCTQKACCVVAGVHIDKVTSAEIRRVLANSRSIVKNLLISYLSKSVN